MAQMDMDAIPPWAVICWETDHDIIVALPMKDGGIPYLMKFPKTSGGLSEALKVLSTQRREAILPTTIGFTIPPTQPMVKTSRAHEQLLKETTEAQREAARRLVAKLGIKS